MTSAPFDDEITTPIGTIDPPAPAAPLDHAGRVKLFGSFKYVADPQPGNTEHIKITDHWDAKNIIPIVLPWHGRTAWVHRLIAPQCRALWQDWADAGLMDRILTFDGAFAPRYKRGQTGSDIHLSNHAWGTAFDVNAKWNRLGYPPAEFGFTGTVVELLPFVEKRGFFWGGHFKGRVDGMHFEAFRVLK